MSNLFFNLPSIQRGIIGHRGMSAQAPENTLAGFKKAAQFGLSWVEFDTQRCASEEWVVFHDEKLDRTTNGTGLVIDTPYKTLKTLDAGSWFHPQFKNERVSTLQDTLSCLADLKLHPNIELKVFEQPLSIEAIADFLNVLHNAWPKDLPPPLVSSFDLKSLKILRSLDNKLPLGYIVRNPTENTLDKILEAGFDSLHCDNQNFSPALLDKATSKSIALPVLVYTVNDPNRMKTLLQKGVTAVFSDVTDVII
ncbi:MAG TPA: glycerophosphodiester phosphodiesterase family protein [Gammaproteobacteria bacterium]|nr:glycerophosphodiester phosphodiesterase family protein [Gammaproteobacteria bacterium]HRA43058.1 glycerophosphodiester phosphodiesterase family protein [Gammaproteobacteria bacterium]